MSAGCSGWRVAVAAVLLSVVVGPAAAGDPAAAEGDVVSRIGRTRWTAGNSVRLLTFPGEAWQARLDLIAGARHHVFISTFSWHEDHYGDLFRERLAQVVAERRRVNPDFVVYCLVDATARGTFDRSFTALEKTGAIVRSFNRQSWGVGPLYDPRMHDKMIIVDGRRAVVGGRNIADEYYDPSRWWLDFGVLLEGEAVWDLQLNFLKTWQVSDLFGNAHRFFMSEEAARRQIRTLWNTGRLPSGKSPLDRFLSSEFFPPPDPHAGDRKVAVLYDNPLVRRTAATTELLVELVKRSVHEIDLMTPFPNFTHELTEALSAAVARGVRVRLFVNSEDAALRRGPFMRAGIPTLIQLIGGGVEVWAWSGNGHIRRILDETGCKPNEVPPVALHGKLVRIDDELTIVHSSNFNIRSTYYNTEAGVVVRDAAFNADAEKLLDDLISLHDLRLECGEAVDDLTVSHVVERLGPDDVPRLRTILGNRQRWVDSMGLLW